jgi:hypothetical protein
MHQQIAHKKTVNYHRNIIAHQHGSNKFGWFLGKFGQDSGNEIVLLFFNFQVNLIGGNESDFHPREESGKYQTDNDYSDFHTLRFFILVLKFFAEVSSEEKHENPNKSKGSADVGFVGVTFLVFLKGIIGKYKSGN